MVASSHRARLWVLFVFAIVSLAALGYSSGAEAGCKWVSRGFKSYLSCTGDVARIIGKVTRVVTEPQRFVFRVYDRARHEGMVQLGAPALQEWIAASRDSALRAGVKPMPKKILNLLSCYYGPDRVRGIFYRVGTSAIADLQKFAVEVNGRPAIALDNIIVFSGESHTTNDVLWAHEVRHVQQYREWGIRDFAKRYLRHWNGVEGDATRHENAYAEWRKNDGAIGCRDGTNSFRPVTLLSDDRGNCHLRSVRIRSNVFRLTFQVRVNNHCRMVNWSTKQTIEDSIGRVTGLTDPAKRWVLLNYTPSYWDSEKSTRPCALRVFEILDKVSGRVYQTAVRDNCAKINFGPKDPQTFETSRKPYEIAEQVANLMRLDQN